MKSKIIVGLMVLLIFISGCQNSISQQSITTYSKTTKEKVDNYVTQVMDKTKLPGLSLSVVIGDEIVLMKGYGVEQFNNKTPMTEDSSLSIGSVTKSFTALAVLQLVEQGKIDLDKPVVEYLPEFRTAIKEQSDQITVKMLLSNTAGLIRDIPAKTISENEYLDNYECNQIVAKLEGTELLFEPGTAYSYSNIGFTAVGAIIEKVTGIKYEEYIAQYILNPLQMKKSTTDGKKFDQLAVLYGHNAGINEWIPANQHFEPQNLPAGSQFKSSARDMGKYMSMLLNGGKFQQQQIISSDLLIDELFKPQIKTGEENSYCLGWSINTEANIIWHDGSVVTASSMVILDTENKIGISLLWNIGSSHDIDICRVAFNILNIIKNNPIMDDSLTYPERTILDLSKEQLIPFLGEYESPINGFIANLYLSNDQLICELKDASGKSSSKVEFVEDKFGWLVNKAFEFPIEFISEAGQIAGFVIAGGLVFLKIK